eukprot:2224273-Pleurochrysis_carterae.AAC.4
MSASDPQTLHCGTKYAFAFLQPKFSGCDVQCNAQVTIDLLIGPEPETASSCTAPGDYSSTPVLSEGAAEASGVHVP